VKQHSIKDNLRAYLALPFNASEMQIFATIQPVFTDAERLALAGFLAGYRG
jgi:hypothetical protein